MSADCHSSPRVPAPRKTGEEPSASREPTIVLVGRPNSGKSSLFNRVTGGEAHVGNFPGLTVDVLEASVELPELGRARLVDLPGLYTLEAPVDPDTDEGIARRFLDDIEREGGPLLVVQVADATRLALGLRLTAELVRRGLPLLVIATQDDLLRAEGRELDAPALSSALGVPVLRASARDPSTRERVLEAVSERLRTIETPARVRRDWDPDALARRVIHERDDIDARALRRRQLTARLDGVLLHPLLGPLLFVGIMAAIFSAVFLVADPVSSVLDRLVQLVGKGLTRLLGQNLLSSFLADGVLGGAGTVLAFLPQIVILTLAMELLEATGYLARGAFLVDRLLRIAGLGGRAFVPLMTAHACAVPAIAATRIMRDPRERLTTIAVLPLMTCSARIPVYGLLISTFFGERAAWIKALMFVGLYFTGITAGLVASLVVRRLAVKGRGLPLVLEMPAYRAPEAHVVARACIRAGWRFVRDVGTTILAASVVLWALLTIPPPGAPPASPGEPPRVAAVRRSVAAEIGRALEPVTSPLGFDWRINVGLIGSFGARELMVGTMGVIFGIEDAEDDATPLAQRVREARRPDGTRAYSPASGLALMAFFVFACQCMSTVAAIRRETRSWRWPAFVLGYTYSIAYLAALVTYQVAHKLGLG